MGDRKQKAFILIMNIYTGFTYLLIGLTSCLYASDCWGQADPEWLKSYNEAYANRPANISSQSRIAAKDEAGDPLYIHGQVFTPNGKPASHVLVHAYHRDHKGFDFGPNDNTLTTWRLQAWAITNAQGQFTFETIQPAPDHVGREGAHIHFTLVSDKFGRQWAPTVYFANDSLIPASERQQSKLAGKFAWIKNIETKDNIGHVEVKFKLKNDPDF